MRACFGLVILKKATSSEGLLEQACKIVKIALVERIKVGCVREVRQCPQGGHFGARLHVNPELEPWWLEGVA